MEGGGGGTAVERDAVEETNSGKRRRWRKRTLGETAVEETNSGEEAVEESFDDDGPRRVKMDRDGGIVVMDLRTKKRNIVNSRKKRIVVNSRKNKDNDDSRKNKDIDNSKKNKGIDIEGKRRHRQRTKTETTNFQLNRNEARFIDFDTSTTSSRELKWDFFLSHRCDTPIRASLRWMARNFSEILGGGIFFRFRRFQRFRHLDK